MSTKLIRYTIAQIKQMGGKVADVRSCSKHFEIIVEGTKPEHMRTIRLHMGTNHRSRFERQTRSDIRRALEPVA